MFRTCLKEAFLRENSSARVVDCVCCEEVPDILTRVRPDVVILEYCEHSTHLARTVASWKSILPAVKVLILSAQEHERYEEAARAAGADAYLTTASSFERLRETVFRLAHGELKSITGPDKHVPHELMMRDPASRLSDREFETLLGLCRGMRAKEIADDLAVGEKTVHEYRRRLCAKMNLRTPADMVRLAIDQGLIPCACQRTMPPRMSR